MTGDPIRVSIANVDTLETITAWANPTTLNEARGATYAEQQVHGLSFRPLHFTGSENVKFSTTFWVDLDHAETQQPGVANPRKIQEFAAFLRRATAPSIVGGVRQTSPSRLLLVWPGILAWTVVLTRLELGFTEFVRTGGPAHYTAACEFTRILDSALSDEGGI